LDSGDLKKEYAKALEYYKKALEVKPNYFNAIMLAGACAYRTGDAEAAVSYYSRGEQLRPDSWLPPYNMACLLATQGKTDEAIEHLKQSVEKDTGTRVLAHFFETDEDLASLRGLPAFEELRAKVAGRRIAAEGDSHYCAALPITRVLKHTGCEQANASIGRRNHDARS
jgi:tetratricopeptide (TPR) repeat protein